MSAEKKWHPVEYGGYWNIQNGEYYGDKNVLDADDVGEGEAEENAKLCANAPELNQQNEKLRKLVEVQEEYINLLGEELDEVVVMMAVHGWQSSRVEKGKKLRAEIAKLKSELNK